MSNDVSLALAAKFAVRGKPILSSSHGQGHINSTILVVTDAGHLYVLQRINTHVFKKPLELMENIAAVTEHIRKKVSDPRRVLHIIPTLEGRSCLVTEGDAYWRMYDFITDGICLETAETAEDFYESGVGFGEFQNQLADFPVTELHETIVAFHDTTNRYRNFRAALAADACGRAADVQEEIDAYLAREEEGGTLHRMKVSGELSLRVTHNDTKLNNVMLDLDTRKPLCIMDLDTVMPGLSLYDFGDAIRFGASTAAEDEKDLGKVSMDLGLFETYTRGYLSACGGSLTQLEIKMLPMGAKIMTLECGVRFLTDYLEGDVYFKTDYPGQNLDRARTQLKLVMDMEAKWEQMHAAVRKLAADIGK